MQIPKRPGGLPPAHQVGMGTIKCILGKDKRGLSIQPGIFDRLTGLVV
jgi:hypothetical protein